MEHSDKKNFGLNGKPKVYKNILGCIGNTPLVQINNIAANIKCQILAKCEFFNAGGSTKDRIAKKMILEEMKKGRLHPGDTVIEPTSGNTGIGIALIGAVLGLKVIVTMSAKNSKEKIRLLKALGAKVVVTPETADFDDPDGYMAEATRLHKEIENSFLPNQYENTFNPRAHYEGTAEELLEQCNEKIDMIVLGVGTGGTLSGISKKFREKIPECVIVGVDPEGSLLANEKDPIGPYLVEGIGYDIIPKVFDRNDADIWRKCTDKDSFMTARRLIREEGILCGGSSGSAMFVALEEAKKLRGDQKCIVLLPDSVRNYMSKFLDDEWLADKGMMDIILKNNLGKSIDVRSINLKNSSVSRMKIKNNFLVSPNSTSKQIYKLMIENGLNAMAVASKGKEGVDGYVLRGDLNCHDGRETFAVSEKIKTDFKKVFLTDPLATTEKMFENHKVLAVFSKQNYFDGEKSKIGKRKCSSVFIGLLEMCDYVHQMKEKGEMFIE